MRIIHAVLDRVQTLTIVAPLIYQIPVRSATLPGSASVKVANSATRDATLGQGAPVCSWIRHLRLILSSLRVRAARTGNSSRRGQSPNRRDGGTVMQGVPAPRWRRSRLLSRRCSRISIAPVDPQLCSSYLYCLYHARSPRFAGNKTIKRPSENFGVFVCSQPVVALRLMKGLASQVPTWTLSTTKRNSTYGSLNSLLPRILCVILHLHTGGYHCW